MVFKWWKQDCTTLFIWSWSGSNNTPGFLIEGFTLADKTKQGYMLWKGQIKQSRSWRNFWDIQHFISERQSLRRVGLLEYLFFNGYMQLCLICIAMEGELSFLMMWPRGEYGAWYWSLRDAKHKMSWRQWHIPHNNRECSVSEVWSELIKCCACGANPLFEVFKENAMVNCIKCCVEI